MCRIECEWTKDVLQIDIKGLPLITAQTFDQSSDQRGSDLQINALSGLFSYLVGFHKATGQLSLNCHRKYFQAILFQDFSDRQLI